MFKISTSDRIMLHYLWVKCHQIRSWKDCTSQNWKILFNFRLWWHCTIQKRREPRSRELSQIEDRCKTSYWSDDEDSKLQSERKVGECFQWKAHGECCKGDSCSFSHDIQDSGNRGQGQRRKGRSSSPASHSKAKQTDGDGQKSSQGSGSKQENSLDKREIPCRFSFCKNQSCKFWHPPVMSEVQVWKKDVHMATNAISDMLRQKESPTRSRRRVVRKDQLLY